MTPPPSTPSAATISSSAASFWPPPTGVTDSVSAWLTGRSGISAQNRRSSSRTVALSSSVSHSRAASGLRHGVPPGTPESAAAPPPAWPSAAVIASAGYSMTGRAHTRGTHSAQPRRLVLGHLPGVEAELGAAHVLEGEPGEVAERAQVRRVRRRDDERRHEGAHRGERLERLRHQQHLLGAERLHVVVGDVVRLEEGRDEAQRVAGVVARLGGDVDQEVVVLAEPGEELGAVRDEPLRDLLGVVVAGERALAVGDVDAAGAWPEQPRRRSSPVPLRRPPP